MIKFCIQSGELTCEGKAVFNYSSRNNIECEFNAVAQDCYIPVGSVEYCLQQMKNPPPIIFYPKFMQEWDNIYRSLIKHNSKNGPVSGFFKDATGWKTDFESRVYNNEEIPSGWYYKCEEVKIQNEWRLYVTNGRIVTHGWYAGKEEKELCHKTLWRIESGIPDWFSGTIDVCTDEHGFFLLVESHPPFACGWYGPDEDDDKYVEWLINGWEYLNET